MRGAACSRPQTNRMSSGGRKAPTARGIHPFALPCMSKCTGICCGRRWSTASEASAATSARPAGYQRAKKLRIMPSRAHPGPEVVDDVLEHGRIEFVDDLLSDPRGEDELGVAQDGEMAG